MFLNFKEAGAEFVSQMDDKTVSEGETVEFKVEVSKPDSKVRWYVNSERIISDENFELAEMNTIRKLKIIKALPEQSGKVKCVLYGDKHVEAALKVNGNFL